MSVLLPIEWSTRNGMKYVLSFKEKEQFNPQEVQL